MPMNGKGLSRIVQNMWNLKCSQNMKQKVHCLSNIKQIFLAFAIFKAFWSSLILTAMHFLQECLCELNFCGQSTLWPQGVGHPWPWWPLTCWSKVGLLWNVHWHVLQENTSWCVLWCASMLWFSVNVLGQLVCLLSPIFVWILSCNVSRPGYGKPLLHVPQTCFLKAWASSCL